MEQTQDTPQWRGFLVTMVLNRQPEVVERVLRVTRHRGFTLQSMKVDTHEQQLNLTMELTSDKAIELLMNQLAKLYDVQECQYAINHF